MVRRERPKIVYSENVKTFKAEAKLLQKINKDEKSRSKSRTNRKKKKFIIPKAPWWDDQFERLTGLTKHSLHKSIRRSQMTYYELEEILLDVEINLNNRPLTYVVDDIQLNVLTTNSMIVERDVRTINSIADGDSDEWTKRQR